MSLKSEVLQKLKEEKEYLSGQQLCESLGVSRTAVWKAIGRLKEEGYQIEAVTNRGYRLLTPEEEQDLFNQEEISSRLHTAWAGQNLYFKEETGSTNDDVFGLAQTGAPQGTLVVAVRQTAGKGRRGRTWLSPLDGNAYFSILLRPSYPAETAPMVTPVAAMAVYAALQEVVGEQNCRFGIKWPNDIVVSSGDSPWKKICGILTEMHLEESEIRDVIIGIGLNVNMTEFAPEIRQTGTSVRLACGHTVNRASLVAAVWNHFEGLYEQFTMARTLAPLREKYEEALVNKDRPVRVLDPAAPYEGTAMGVNDSGELLVQPADGSGLRAVSAGEVSVRGVEGYV